VGRVGDRSPSRKSGLILKLKYNNSIIYNYLFDPRGQISNYLLLFSNYLTFLKTQPHRVTRPAQSAADVALH